MIDTGPNFETLPIFDMNQLISQGSERNQLIIKLREVCHHVGFFYIKNHGISVDLMDRMLMSTEAFFNLPQQEKDAINISYSPHYRGYGQLRAETTKGIPDYKESYDLGLEHRARKLPLDFPYCILHGPNQWPSSPILKAMHWKETVLDYIAAMQTLGKQLMMALSLSLGFPEDFFVRQFCSNEEDAFAMLRLLRYPPGRVAKESAEPEVGVGAHIDSGCLVLLLQDEIGGLQVQNCAGQWVDAPFIKGTYVVNIGEMLQIWSNNYFLATPHRVINTSANVRYSAPFFFEPNLSTLVTPLGIADVLLKDMRREPVDPNTRIVYGEQMLNVYQRSFKA